MNGYNVTIELSSKNLTSKERVLVKDTTNANQLDELTQVEQVIIDIDYYVALSVHNEYSEDKDYKKYVIVDKGGRKYVTGSESFFLSLTNIMDEMAGTDEDFCIEVYRKPSKNYKGKEFLACSIM